MWSLSDVQKLPSNPEIKESSLTLDVWEYLSHPTVSGGYDKGFTQELEPAGAVARLGRISPGM